MLAYIAPIVVFGLVIFVHELGHFIAAKLVGVYAPRFSIGFGPALFRRRRGETEYVLAALPLGGYVRMASRHDAETAFLEGGNEESGALKPGDPGYDAEAMIPFGPKPVPEERWFESKSLPARLFIMIAGVTMNVILTFVVLTALAMAYGEPVVPTRVIGAVRAPANAPALAAIQPGDTLVAINGEPVKNWNDIYEHLQGAKGSEIRIQTSRSQAVVPIGGTGQPTASDVAGAIDYYLPPVIGDVLPGSAASRAGLKYGDTVKTISGTPLTGWSDLQRLVSPSSGKPLVFEIKRASGAQQITITPEPLQVKDPTTKQMTTVGKIGATPADFSTRQSLGFFAALQTGGRQTVISAMRIFDVVHGLITREVSVKQLGGPIAITRQSVAEARKGLESLLFLIALLSVNVAVLNLLPIPILDGGQILINIAEAVKGGPFSMRAREYILRAGLVAILLIFVVSTYNDLSNLVRDVAGKIFG
jgi:regulator of sigma E protease